MITLMFVVEAARQIQAWGARPYFSQGWNRFDFLLMLLDTIVDGGLSTAARYVVLADPATVSVGAIAEAGKFCSASNRFWPVWGVP